MDKISKALIELSFDPFPDDLKKEMKLRKDFKPTFHATVTYIRHYLSNYDRLRKKYKMNEADTREFKAEVNYIIHNALDLYNQFTFLRTGKESYSYDKAAMRSYYANDRWWKSLNYSYIEESGKR